jgi:hypothetical protein
MASKSAAPRLLKSQTHTITEVKWKSMCKNGNSVLKLYFKMLVSSSLYSTF